MKVVRTVTGDIPAESLGRTLSHEHLMIGWPGAPLDPASLPDREGVIRRLTDRMKAAKSGGVDAIIDCTPPTLHRSLDVIVEVSRAVEMPVVAATGMYLEGVGLPWYFHQRTVDEIEAFFVEEISDGDAATGAKCGVIKVATAGATISEDEEKVLRAAARASNRTGVPVTTHTDPAGWAQCNVGLKQLEVFLSEGAEPGQCIIGHACGTSDIGMLLDLLKRGCFLSYDRVGMTGIVPDETRAAVVAALVSAGFANRVMLGHDAVGWIRQRHRAAPRDLPPEGESQPQPQARALSDFGYISRVFIPMLETYGVHADAIDQMLRVAPMEAFAFESDADAVGR